ncbi:zf-HC2 domain-containing protein [Desulfobacterota bacterium AH_259_B03_O07]|nr:zf-HC2 domain-containing protein [Desulfobacterota bacterium AH_259_B03_O07]
MECKRIEGFLIDYIHDDLGPAENELVRRHLLECQDCTKKSKEYEQISKIFEEQAQTQPDPKVLDNLSKIARDELERNNPPFWKRWFYFPILVPALSSIIAISAWIYYENQNLIYSPDETFYSRDVMAKKIPLNEDPNLPEIQEETVSNLESRSGRVLSDRPNPASLPDTGKKSRIQEEAINTDETAPVKEMIARRDVKEVDKSSEYKDDLFDKFETKPLNRPVPKQDTAAEDESIEVGMLAEGTLEEKADQEFREHKGKTQRAGSYSSSESTYKYKLNLALKQKKEGNCEASIKTNEELLKASPPPPDSVKEISYLSLAECYEKEGEWENAIINYRNLQKAAPDQTDFAKEKIKYIRQQTRLLKK